MRLALLRSSRVFDAVLIAAIAGCGGSSGGSITPSGAVAIQPTPNAARDIDATALTVDATAQTATAVITFAASAQPGATLEIGDLDIDSVRLRPSSTDADLPWADRGDRLDLGLPASNQAAVVTVRYRYRLHGNFDGASNSNSNSGQSTYLWPYFCGNLFPCHSQPADGVDYTLEVRNPPSGQRVIAAAVPLNAAPAYQLAWAIGNYVDVDLGRSRAGTQLVASYLPGDGDAMRSGSHR